MQRRTHDLLGRQAGELPEEPLVVGEDVELRRHSAGTQRKNPHPGPLDLLGEGFSEGEHEGLAGCIQREMRERLEGND